MKNFKVSVIIPTYKPREYLFECIDSVMNQTLEKSQYEVIVVLNGCCEPWYSELLQRVRHVQEPSIRLLQTDVAGVSNARNMALDIAQGEYIVFVDDDDYISPSYLSDLCSLAAPDAIIATRLILFDDATHETFATNLTNAYQIARESNLPLTLYTGRRFLSCVAGKIIPMSNIGGKRFDTHLALGEDSVFITGITQQIRHIGLAPETAVYYVRRRADSASRKPISNTRQVGNALSLAWRYAKMYVADIRHNDFKFYMSRIVASLLKAFMKKYRTV